MGVIQGMDDVMEMVAPGTDLRIALDMILSADNGALICIGDLESVLALSDGGFEIDVAFTPNRLFELSKMDGAILLDAHARRIVRANVHLSPTMEYETKETGMRHRTAMRMCAQTDTVAITVSQRRNVIDLYFGGESKTLGRPLKSFSQLDSMILALQNARESIDHEINRLIALENASSLLAGHVSKNPSTAAIIVAGGEGERFRNPGGKQLFEVLGKPVLTWSAEAFDAVPDVGVIVIVCPEERQAEYCRKAIDPYPFVTPIEFAASGEVRQESALNGFEALAKEYEIVAVHDGARPLITPEIISHAINHLKGNLDIDGIVVGHPSVDTLKIVSDRMIAATPDRSAFWVAQTPQLFRTDIFRRAYRSAMYDGFVGTDDSSLVERIGGRVAMFNGPRDNIKLTVPEDVGPVVAALSARVAQREE